MVQSAEGQNELDRQRVAIARFEIARANAPVYKTEIRSLLIKNPTAYRASYRSGSAEFKGQPESLRCPHDPSVVEALSDANWQIVKCDFDSATFFRRHAEGSDESRRCFDRLVGAKKPDIGDVFETLNVGFRSSNAEFAKTRPSMRDFMQRVSNYLPGNKVEVDQLRSFHPLGNFEDYTFFEKDWLQFRRFYGLDEDRQRLVQFDLRQNNECKRNPVGWVRTRGHIIMLDSPQPSIRSMDEALSRVVDILPKGNV